jgi:hypothetical protein
LVPLLLTPIFSLVAEDEPVLRVKLDDPQPANKNRFGISYRANFNITAEFQNVANARPGPAGGRGPGPATGGVDHFYDDGYNREDSTHSGGGITWFWGYKNNSQISGDTLSMHSSSAAPINSKTIDSDIQHGAELTWNRELGRRENNCSWGLESALGWTDIEIRDRRPLGGGVRTVTDVYNLGGINPNVPPQSAEYPGHAGTFEGPGPLIEDTPTRSVDFSANSSLVTGRRRFDGDLFTLRVGPYLEIPIDDQWSISLSAGGAVGLIDGEYRFRHVVTTPGGTGLQSGSGSKSDVLFGGYVNMVIHWAITEQWGMFVGGQYMGLTDYTLKARGTKVELDFARTASFTGGVSFSF